MRSSKAIPQLQMQAGMEVWSKKLSKSFLYLSLNLVLLSFDLCLTFVCLLINFLIVILLFASAAADVVATIFVEFFNAQVVL